MRDPTAPPLLKIDGLKTWFHTDEGLVKAVDDVSLSIAEGQTLGVVGESGSGKEGISIFEDHGPFDWLGHGRVMCVDYSVGRRARERRGAGAEGPSSWTGTLAALRTGVWELAFDDRDPVKVGVPG